MKKRFLLLVILLFACVFFTSENYNELMACGTNKIACNPVMKKGMKKISTGYVDETDPVMYLLINPLVQ